MPCGALAAQHSAQYWWGLEGTLLYSTPIVHESLCSSWWYFMKERKSFMFRVRIYCTTLHYTALHYTALHCTTLHCTALHYTTLSCTYLLLLSSPLLCPCALREGLLKVLKALPVFSNLTYPQIERLCATSHEHTHSNKEVICEAGAALEEDGKAWVVWYVRVLEP